MAFGRILLQRAVNSRHSATAQAARSAAATDKRASILVVVGDELNYAAQIGAARAARQCAREKNADRRAQRAISPLSGFHFPASVRGQLENFSFARRAE
jgi:hypothetical protein